MKVWVERASLGDHAHAVRAARAAGLGPRKRKGAPHSERNDASPSCASLACLGADPRRPECRAATAGARQGRAVRTATPVVGLEGAHHASARRDGAASVRLRARKVRSTGATAAVRGEGECVGEGRRDRPNRRKAHAALEIKPTPCGAIYLQHVRFWGESAATLASSPKKLAGN